MTITFADIQDSLGKDKLFVYFEVTPHKISPTTFNTLRIDPGIKIVFCNKNG